MPSRLYNETLLQRCLADARPTIKIQVTNGGTLTSIGMSDIVEGSFYIDRYVTNGTFIYYGTACASECGMTLIPSSTITLTNIRKARITVKLNVAGYVDGNGKLIDIPMGVFNVYEVNDVNGRYQVTCLDDMIKLNKPANNSFFNSGKPTPNIIAEIVSACGVPSSGVFPTRTYNIPSRVVNRLKQNTYTYRDWLIWICEITSTNAYFDENGELRFSQFNNIASNFTITSAMRMQDSSNYEYALKGVGEIKFEHESSELYAFPNDGAGQYKVEFTGNEFFKSMPYAYASNVMGNVQDDYMWLTSTGQAYNPFSCTTINLPFIMPMDRLMYEPKGGVAFYTLVSHTRWVLDGTMLIECKGEGTSNGETYTQSGTSASSSAYITQGEIAGWKIEGNKAFYDDGNGTTAEINLTNVGTEHNVISINSNGAICGLTGFGDLVADYVTVKNEVEAKKLSSESLTTTTSNVIHNHLDLSSSAPNQNALVPLMIDVTTGKIYQDG